MCCRSSEAFPERWPNRQADRAAETLAARDALDVPTMLLNETDLLQARAWTAADSRRSPRRPAAVLHRHAGEARKGAAAEQHVARLLARCEGAATPAVQTITARVRLTPGELDAAVQAAAGRTNKQVASDVHLSVRTVPAGADRGRRLRR